MDYGLWNFPVKTDPDSASAPPSSGRGNYLPTQSQESYHSASSSPSARRPSSGFDGVNQEANIRANAAVVDGHADVRASAVMTDDNDEDADDGNFEAKSLALHPGSQLLSTLISFLAPSTSTTTTSDCNLCQDTCFLSGSYEQDFINQKSKISGRYEAFEGCKNKHDYT